MSARVSLWATAALVTLAGGMFSLLQIVAQPLPNSSSANELRAPSAFQGVVDQRARALALFEEAGKVLTHPRCVNCHPVGERPMQTDRMIPHQPPVIRGADGNGAPNLSCNTCHGPANYDPARVPGHPNWHLAPASMAWQGKSLGEICQQLKDPTRNGGKDMAALLEHSAHDSLVGWGWQPGPNRSPAPGSQAIFGQLMRAWADAGAHCPPS
jgi:hypothetical protein